MNNFTQTDWAAEFMFTIDINFASILHTTAAMLDVDRIFLVERVWEGVMKGKLSHYQARDFIQSVIIPLRNDNSEANKVMCAWLQLRHELAIR